MFIERLKLSEQTNLSLSKPNENSLPTHMICRYNHKAYYNYVSVNDRIIPFYICESCEVVYRYQELQPITE